MTSTLWNWLTGRGRKAKTALPKKRTSARHRLNFERLEERWTPATFTVTTTAAAGVGSFVAAINSARLDPTPSIIDFTLAAVGATINLAAGNGEFLFNAATTPVTNRSITINGANATVNATGAYRLFNLNRVGLTLIVNSLSLTGGAPAAPGNGGAIIVGSGTLNLNTVTLANNRAENGGGILQAVGSNVNFNNVTVRNNTATVNGGGYAFTGGGFNGLPTLTNNTAGGGGGGYFGLGLANSTLSFTGASTGNRAGAGGGLILLSNCTNTTITAGTTISANIASGDGGGIQVVGTTSTVTLDRVLVTGNTSAADGGGVSLTSGTLTIVSSQFTNNVAGVRGGGLFVTAGVANVTGTVFGGPSALAANRAATGGAVGAAAGTTTLTSVTIANNVATTAGSGVAMANLGTVAIRNSTISNNPGPGGVSVTNASAVMTLINNTIAFNGTSGVVRTAGIVTTANTIFSNNSGADYTGLLTSNGNNLFGNSAGITGGTVASDLLNVDPLLGPLAVNGATAFLSFTHALLANSPAYNAGNNAQASAVGLTTDQRGSPRFISTVDIGAYELVDNVAPVASFAVPANINGASIGTNTTTIVVTYADIAGTGLQGASGIDFTTIGADDIVVSNGAVVLPSPVRNGNQVTYTVRSPGATWGASGQGTYSVSLVNGGVLDRAGNAIVGVPNVVSFFVDTAPPTAAMTTPPPNINVSTGGTSTNSFTVTFSDATSGVNAATIGSDDFTVNNGATVTLMGRIGNVATYTITAPTAAWNMSPQGTYTISLVAGSVLDNAGNPIAGVANFGSFLVSTVRPFATLTTQPANITVANATPGTNSFVITYTTLGAPLNPATYGPGNVTVTNGGTTLSVISVIPNPSNPNALTYTVQAPGGMWTNPPQGQYTIALNGNSVFDIAGNDVLANPTLGFFTVDAFRPTATLSSPPATINLNYIGPQSNTFSITYADVGLGVDPSTFNSGNITVMNGATVLSVNTSMVSGNTVTYTALAPGGNWATAPMGTYTIAIVGNSVKDLAGNGITANPNFAFFLVDLNRPTAALTTPPVNINVANSGPGNNTFTITYTDVGSGMNPATYVAGNVTVSNGATTLAVTNVAVLANVVTYTVAPPGGNWAAVPEGTYTVNLNANSVFDLAGNAVNPIPNLTSFTVDVSNPTVVVTTPLPLTNASQIPFTINFSEPVTGLTAAEIIVTNGTAGTLTQITPSQYTLPVTPTVDGFVTVQVPAGVAQDLAGNPNLVSNIAVAESDRTGPIATFSPPSAPTTVSGPITYTITWTDPHFSAVTLTAAQVILNTTGTANVADITVTGAGNTRLVTLSNIFGNGTIALSLPPGTAVDTLGNLSPAAGPSASFSVSGNRILNISQPPAPAIILPGTTYVYAIDFSNTGNQISPNARIIANLPPPGSFLPGSSTAGWTSIGGGLFQFSLGNFAIGASGRINFAVNYPANTPPNTVATFTAFITDTLGNGAPVASSTVVSRIVNPNRLRWGRCC